MKNTVLLTAILSFFIITLLSNNVEALDYAWAGGHVMDDQCMVIIWIRGNDKDKRNIYKAKIENNLCTVNIDNIEFEKNFEYCVLSGITVDDTDSKYTASFGGGPAGGRKQYWFEWSVGVRPNFYCLLK